VDPELPKSLVEAMATEPLWLRSWINVLVAVNLSAVLFVVGRESGRWRVRREPIAILAGFIAAAVLMDWLYGSIGYVRLLGVAHLVCWGPVWFWILSRRGEYPWRSLFGGYLHVYLLVAGVSLMIDLLDVVRYLLGDGELFGRWAGG
jgi:hypothetical protein